MYKARVIVLILCIFVSLPFNTVYSEKKLSFSESTLNSPFFYEGSNITLRVECDGVNESGVSISLISMEGKNITQGETNNNGEVTLKLPNVLFSMPLKATAEKYGYIGSHFFLWVLKKPMLYLSFPRIVNESKIFQVHVLDSKGKFVPDAHITFGDIEGFTNSNGIISLQAPAVGISTSLYITADKAGYRSARSEIWIANNYRYPVIVPHYVEEGKDFTIVCNNSVDNVNISFNGFRKNTANGRVTFTAPYVKKTSVYQIIIYSMNGTLMGYSSIIVLNSENESILLWGPNEVLEGNSLTLRTLSLSTLKGVSNITIRLAGEENITDKHGNVTFTAPTVNNAYQMFNATIEGRDINWTIWVKEREKKTLYIEGPTSAYEGDNVTFKVVTEEGVPTLARVYFGNETKFTINGSINFTVPSVPKSQYITIRASNPGYKTGYTQIYIKTKEKRLIINIDSPSVKEGSIFYVTVTDSNDKSITNASVWFNFQRFQTDVDGKVRLTAPDVLLTTNYLIYAEKDGFEMASQWITIEDVGIGQNFMDLITPLAVNSWTEFAVRTVDKLGKGISNVSISINYGSYIQTIKTDNDGKADMRSPVLADMPYFIITAEKEGYNTITDKVFLMEKNQILKNLVVRTLSSEVKENEQIVIHVEDDLGNPVKGATVWIDGKMITSETDKNGIINTYAPSVPIDKSCFIFATKPGYNFGYTWINVINTVEIMESPNIETKGTVSEGQKFIVEIKDPSGNPMEGARVLFNSLLGVTSKNGTVLFTAPYVDKDTFFIISVNSNGYAPAFKMIEVLDRLGKHEENGLVIYSVPVVLEGENFTVTVKDTYGYLVGNAIVTFNNQIEKHTDEYGQAVFKAPQVDRDTTYRMIAAKLNYESSSFYIKVKNMKSGFIERYLYLIIIIFIVILIALIAFFYYKQYMI